MAFDLGEALRGVSELGTGREQIEYIRLDRIDEDPNNFYQLSDIDQLAANIELCGLQQPIRVRPIEGTDRYMIVSGHRRRKAIEMLANDEPERWAEVSCIVERDEASPALQQLRLIYANANTRKMTPAEVSAQAEQVEKLLYQLKEEGYEFPGRMRDHVAQAVQVSKSKLARLKVIRDNLCFEWQQPFKDDRIGESVAYALAQLPQAWQRLIFSGCTDPKYLYEGTVQEYARRFRKIDAMCCGPKKDRACGHKTIMMELSCKERWQDPCRSRCCWECISLRTCKHSCAAAAGRKKDQQEKQKAETAAAKAQREEETRPKVAKIDAIWQRFGQAREEAGKDWKQCMKAMELGYFPYDEQKVMELECGESKITPDIQLPCWISVRDANKLTALADFLGCSVDYLLCRTDERNPAPYSDTGWKTGNPEAYGTYAAYVKVAGAANPMLRELLWTGDEWLMFGQKISDDVAVQCWAERPEVI